VVGSFLAFVFLCLGVGVAAYALTDVPDPDDFAQEQQSTVYFANGDELGSFPGPNRTIVDYEALPPFIGQAVVSAEDRTFFENQGVSITGMGRAFLNNIRGGDTQGGSTLTQQYVERFYVGETTTGYVGKAKEALLAIKIGQTETKEQILGRYLNTIYFGRDSYGIEAAAQAYFTKSAADLTVSEAALLAGIIPSPNNWDPAVSPEKAEQRWNYVLDGMVRDGYLTDADRAAQVFPATVPFARSNTYGGSNGYLLQYVKQELTATGSISEEMLGTAGLKITTTIEQPAQQAALDAVAKLRSGELSGGATPSEALRVGVVSIDPATGGIVSMYGGDDFLVDQIDRASRDRIQAGSTFKPFTLIAALENGIPLSKRYDGRSPQDFPGWDNVRNFGGTDYGNIDLVKATEQSVNTVYAQVNLEVGPEKTVDVAGRAGITTPVESVPSNVLGSATVRPIDMASAYATIAAQGVYHKPFMVSEATYPDGDVAYTGETQPTQVFDADVMADTTYAMTQVVENGSGERYIKPLDREIAGKTGTSTENKSAWFVGFTPQIATAVAFSQVGENGKDQVTITPWGRGVDEITGSTWPAATWAAYMEPVLALEKYATPTPFPDRANVNGKPTPTATPTTQAPVETTPPEPEQPTTVAVPTLAAGALVGDAQAALSNAGLVGSVTEVEVTDGTPAGTVLGLDPGAGAQVAPGSTVTIRVAKAPAPAPTPAPGQGQGQGQGQGNAVAPGANG
jgi:membrane peptidoglycan carboxypeptidase